VQPWSSELLCRLCADLIMLAHEEGRMEHFLFGRSNEELIRQLPCSIFLVKKEPAIFGVE
jgi:nucleotide-binding universal stress UspA family protein